MTTIKCAPNGPLLVEGKLTFLGPDGQSIEHEGKMALCRCGASQKKPYCDGSHAKAGFSDENQSDPDKNQKRPYSSEKVTVKYNRELCTHAARCVDNLKQVFDPEKKPWIQPEQASPDQVMATVKKCPSGALTFESAGQEEIEFGYTEEAIKIGKNGPYYVEGPVELADVSFAKGAAKDHYALCRCGQSRNKPFCDGYHHDIGFKPDEE